MENTNQSQKKLVLLFGVTGGTGFHIANSLLESGKFPLRVVVRNKSKVTKLFAQKQMGFQSIIEGDIFSDEVLKRAFEPSRHYGQVKIVISALGCMIFDSQKNIANIESIGLPKVMKFAKQNNVQRYILISGVWTTKPWNPLTVILNTIIPNVYYHKSLCENYLRTCGLNYTIVRPPILEGDFEDNVVMGYDIGQGTKKGNISRKTLGSVVIHSLLSKDIADRVTFDVEGNKNKKQCLAQNFGILKQDNQQSIIKNGHKVAKYSYLSTLFAGATGLTYFLINKYVQKQ